MFCRKPFVPASSVKWSCFRFLPPPPRREPLQGTGLQEGVTQSICRATDTISAYINHISTARPQGACRGDSFMAHLQNATCQSAESDRYQSAGTLHCHTDSFGRGNYFQNENCNDLQITHVNLWSDHWITTVHDPNENPMSFTWWSTWRDFYEIKPSIS